jgi:hypothetical protein
MSVVYDTVWISITHKLSQTPLRARRYTQTKEQYGSSFNENLWHYVVEICSFCIPASIFCFRIFPHAGG